ncbi:MAG: hypothetical protein J5I93_25335 [Pirellulaceae bacterium]|nr:hypothetical protein [Pirellulaceae bacterium]
MTQDMHRLAWRLGLFHGLLGLATLALLVACWPAGAETTDLAAAFSLLGQTCQLSAGQRMVLLVILAGLLGSLIHGSSSLADYVGNQRLSPHWVWWYLLRPFIGASLALGVYVVFRAGLISSNSDGGGLNLFGCLAISFLSGLFSKQALDKLNEVFSTLFRTAEGDRRADKLTDGPEIHDVQPANVPRGAAAASLTLNGSGFLSSSEVLVDGRPRPTTFVSPNEVRVALQPEDCATAGTLRVMVVNSQPGRSLSRIVEVPVVEPAAP